MAHLHTAFVEAIHSFRKLSKLTIRGLSWNDAERDFQTFPDGCIAVRDLQVRHPWFSHRGRTSFFLEFLDALSSLLASSGIHTTSLNIGIVPISYFRMLGPPDLFQKRAVMETSQTFTLIEIHAVDQGHHHSAGQDRCIKRFFKILSAATALQELRSGLAEPKAGATEEYTSGA